MRVHARALDFRLRHCFLGRREGQQVAISDAAGGSKLGAALRSPARIQGAQRAEPSHQPIYGARAFTHMHVPRTPRPSRALCCPCAQDDIHPCIVALGLKYANGSIRGANARCVAMLLAFKTVVGDYVTPPEKAFATQDLDKRLRPLISFLIECRPKSISMGNAIKVRERAARTRVDG